MLMRALSVHIAHETAGAARIRHSLRPHLERCEDYSQTSGASCRENANTHSAVIVRDLSAVAQGAKAEGGRSSIPETLMIESRSRGVLDHPPSRVMTDASSLPPSLVELRRTSRSSQ